MSDPNSGQDVPEVPVASNAVGPTVKERQIAPGIVRNVAYPVAFVAGINCAAVLVIEIFGNLPTWQWITVMVRALLGMLGMVWLCNAFKRHEALAWYVQIVLAILAFIPAFGHLGFPSLLIQGIPLGIVFHLIILCFWFRPETKAWFGLNRKSPT